MKYKTNEKILDKIDLFTINESKDEVLIHASKNKLELNKKYEAKKSKGTFGDWEIVFDKLKPSGTVSRLQCFFAVKNKRQIEDSGILNYNHIYTFSPIGKYDKCQVAWLGKIMQEVTGYSKGYKVNYGYLLNWKEMIKNEKEKIEEYLSNYYKNKPIRLSYEISLTEYLCPVIKVIKELSIY